MARIHFEIEKGNLGAEPEISFLKDNTCMAKLSIAVNRYRKDEDDEWEQVGETSWINGTAFGYAAELIESMELNKGDSVYAKGHMEARTWENKEGEEVRGWDFLISQLFPIPKLYEEEEDERPKRRSSKRGRKSSSRRSSGKRSSSKHSSRKSKSRKSSSKKGKKDYASKILAQLKK